MLAGSGHRRPTNQLRHPGRSEAESRDPGATAGHRALGPGSSLRAVRDDVGNEGAKPAITHPVRTALTRLTLTDFRSYERAELVMDGRPVFLVGPNGAGKTNLLEAVSLLTPGRGLRGSSLAEVGRRLPGEAKGRPWAVAATISKGREETKLGTGVEQAGAARRTVRTEGETVPPGRLAEPLRQVWLTPA